MANKDVKLLAHLMRGQNLMYSGDWKAALEHCDKALTFHVLPDHQTLALKCGFDPAVHAMAWKAYTNLILGRPETAKTCAQQSIGLAEMLAHPSSLVFAYMTPGADFNFWMHDPIAAES